MTFLHLTSVYHVPKTAILKKTFFQKCSIEKTRCFFDINLLSGAHFACTDKTNLPIHSIQFDLIEWVTFYVEFHKNFHSWMHAFKDESFSNVKRHFFHLFLWQSQTVYNQQLLVHNIRPFLHKYLNLNKVNILYQAVN